MNSQKTFSFFKNKTPRFDWEVILITGGVAIVVIFLTAWYLLGVIQERSGDVGVDVDGVVTLEEEVFKQAEERFLQKQKVLSEFLGEGESDLLDSQGESIGSDALEDSLSS